MTMKSLRMAAASAVFAITLIGGAQRAFAHGVQVAYGTTPTGFIRIYIEHWHGDQTSLVYPNNINVTVTSASGTSTFDVNPSGVINNTPVGSLPGLSGPITILATGPYSNQYNDWGYWDFAPGTCNQPVTITINRGNSVVFTPYPSTLYPASITGQTFTDQAPPVITANNVTVVGDCTGANVSYSSSVVDDCDPSPVVTYSQASGSFFPVGTTTVTITATDNTGKTSVKTFNVTVVAGDSTPPSLTVPAPITVNAEAGKCGAAVTFTTSATDNCSTPTVVSTPASGSFFSVGTTTVTSVATDAAGNKTTKTFTVTVVDAEAPKITAPADLALTAGADCTAIANFAATATDNCSGVAVSYSKNPGTAFPLGTTVVTATATDAAGNTASATFNVVVSDKTAPVITAPAVSKTVDCVGADAALAAWLASNGGAAATDTCSAVTWTNNFRGSIAACGSATVVFTAADASGNTATTTATFAVADTTPPVIGVAAANKTVECDGAGNTAALAAWLAGNGGATATDACSSVTWSNNFTALTRGCGATGAATVTFTATDACGNSSTTTATFAIVDTTKPVITAAANKTVECDGAGNTAALAAWLAGNGGATATDACSSVTWSNNFTALTRGCGATGAATVTFTATDACGNSSTTTATFAIVDTTKPAITAAANMTVETDGAGNTAALAAWLAGNGGATATDACSSVTWSNNYSAASFVAACGATGAATVTFTATDACGNATTTTATFTIVDTTKPTIASNVHDISPNIKPDTFVVTGTDIGGSATPSIVKVTATRVNPQGKLQDFTGVYKHTVTGNQLVIEITGGVGTVWTIYGSVVDACGNTTTATYVVNVVNPTLTK